MNTIIAGSRSITDYAAVEAACQDCGWQITEVVCGCARGVDRLGEQWAKSNNIPIKYFPADWDTYGKAAGYRRNKQMAEYADALIALWDGDSKGTSHMIALAKQYNLSCYVHVVSPTQISAK